MKLNIKGVIVPNDYKHVYDYFGIESTSAKDVSDALDAANGQPLEVYINSGGGYVRAGNEIYTLLSEYGGGVNIKIIFAASAASIIAMAGHSAISPVGQLMIHNVASTAEGDYRAMHHAGGCRQRFPRQRLYAQVRQDPRRNPRNDGRGNVDYCPARR